LARWTFAVVVLAFCGVGCGKSGGPVQSPLLLVGVDGLEWSLLMRFVKEGLLPNTQDLLQTGCFGRLETLQPTSSPAIWNTVATGKLPEKHGIPTFAYEEDGVFRLYTSGHRKTKAIWNILSDTGHQVHSIGWWNTFPVESINGVMVAQTASRQQVDTGAGRNVWKGRLRNDLPSQVFPAGREEQIFALASNVEDQLDAWLDETYGKRRHVPSELNRRIWENTRWAFLADATYFEIARTLLQENAEVDALCLYLGSVDVVSHRFWRPMFPEHYDHRPTDEEVEDFGSVIQSAYMWVDKVLGELRTLAPAATIVLVSDHGFFGVNYDGTFDPENPPEAINSGGHHQKPPGVFIAAGGNVEVTGKWRGLARIGDVERIPTVGSVEDVLPTVLMMKGIAIGEDMDGTPMLSVMQKQFRERHPAQRISSYDGEAWLNGRIARRDAAMELEQEISDTTLKQLRELGYEIGEEGGSSGR
jgi:hypothetical protein